MKVKQSFFSYLLCTEMQHRNWPGWQLAALLAPSLSVTEWKKNKIMSSITDNTSGHGLMFICFFHLWYSIRNVNGELFKLNRQKLNSGIRGLGTFLFEISLSFLSPLHPSFPIKLKSISLINSNAFKPSLIFMIAIFPCINKILYTFSWRHRLLLFAGKSGSNILETALCTKADESWKLWELGCSILILYQEPGW